MFPAITSMIATTRSPLQASLSSAGGQIVAIISKGRGASRRPQWEDNYSGSSISSSLVAERNSRLKGGEFASYATPNDANIDILSLIQMCSELVLKCWILQHVQCFGVSHWIRHKNCTLAPVYFILRQNFSLEIYPFRD
jgi:hypothetical protein